MNSPVRAIALTIGLLLSESGAVAQTQIEAATPDATGIEVLFDNAVKISTVRSARIHGFVLRGDPPVPRPLQFSDLEEIEVDSEDDSEDDEVIEGTAEAFFLFFEDIDGAPAFADKDAEYRVVIQGVRGAENQLLGKQSLTFKHGKPALSFSDPVRLWLNEDDFTEAGFRYLRFGGRAYVEVQSVASQLPTSFVDSLETYERRSVNPDAVKVFFSTDKINFRPLPVEAATVNGEAIRLFLGKRLPKGQPVYVRVRLPKDDGSELMVANTTPHTFGGPEGRADSQYYVALSYVSAATTGDDMEDRDEEGILDLKLNAGPWPLFDSGRGAWVRRWQPLLDAKVGTDRPSESESPNRVTLGVDFMFDRTSGTWGEHRVRLGLLHNSDRDFDTREAAADLRWLPVPDRFIRSKELRLAEVRVAQAKAPTTATKRNPRVRAWSVLPMLGVEYGEVLAAPAMPEIEGDDFLRYKVGLDLTMLVGQLTFSLSDTFRLLDEPAGDPPDDQHNILEAGLIYQINALQGVSLKYQKGSDAPTFAEVDTFSVTYEFKY